MTVLDLCQHHYQVLLGIFQMDYIAKNVQCSFSPDYMKVKDNQWSCTQLIFKCLDCNKDYNQDFNKKLINRFSSTYNFCDRDINKFILLLRKGADPYEYMNSWEKFDETSLPNKEGFYTSLQVLITAMQKEYSKN